MKKLRITAIAIAAAATLSMTSFAASTSALLSIGSRGDAVSSVQQELLDKHYLRKHGANAYYGQGK